MGRQVFQHDADQLGLWIEQYAEAWGTEMAEKVAILGALRLYLNYVNLFQFLMMFLGKRR
jgi:FtsH-binding integral membrane protein